jgi:Na+/glutamate symporter
MLDRSKLRGLKDFGRSVSAADSPEKRQAFALAFVKQWSGILRLMILLSGGCGLLAAEEIWRNVFSGTVSSLAILCVTPWIVTGIAVGIILGRWTTRYESRRIKNNIDTRVARAGRLTLSECLPWNGFIIGFFFCFGSGIIIRAILELVHFIRIPAHVWIATGIATMVHGIHHLLWWDHRRRSEFLILLHDALELVSSKSF